jgi:hypothetical protein
MQWLDTEHCPVWFSLLVMPMTLCEVGAAIINIIFVPTNVLQDTIRTQFNLVLSVHGGERVTQVSGRLTA